MRKVVPPACGALTTGLCIGLVMVSGAASAQVTPDGTVNTTVTRSLNDLTITNGTTNGTNSSQWHGEPVSAESEWDFVWAECVFEHWRIVFGHNGSSDPVCGWDGVSGGESERSPFVDE